MSFYFVGQAPVSKSLLNRSLIIKSWFPDLVIKGSSDCDDIKIMKSAVESLSLQKNFYCGLSGTAFRFLTFRLSREKGTFLFTGEEALWNRPFKEMGILLSQLGVTLSRQESGWSLCSQGWNPQGDYLMVPSKTTSQYASALVLNSWNYKKDIYFCLTSHHTSYPYFKMTIDLVKQLGMDIQQSGKEFYIPKNQKLKCFVYNIEQDKSCLFALAAFAVLNGTAIFTNWEKHSLQPDALFLDLLMDMGISVTFKDSSVKIDQAYLLKPISVDLSGYPDLFPILSVLCAKAEGMSCLSGLSQQAFKESHRLNKTKELLSLSGIKTKLKNNTLWIYGKKTWPHVDPFLFDSSNDHRMVMAAQLVKSVGLPVCIQHKDAVDKSFPEFFSLVTQA